MDNIKDLALKYSGYGLSVIPVRADKKPSIKWKPFQDKPMSTKEIGEYFTNTTEGIAIICGAVSNNLEVIDVDTKHDITGTLWGDFSKLLQDNLPEIYSSLIIAQTKSGGYHIYYRCKTIEGNLKLSNRSATAEEREKEKIKILTTIETRGEGGYVIAPNTQGYKYIQNTPENIPEITPEQRDKILYIAKSFSDIIEEPTDTITATNKTSYITPYHSGGLSPFEDYNQRGDVMGLILSNGFIQVREDSNKIYIRRVGSTNEQSGNFHKGLRKLWIFSSNTVFQEGKTYSPTDVFTLLECNGDLSIASKRLYELGYGERRGKVIPTKVETKSTKIIGVNSNDSKVILSKPSGTLKTENVKAGDVRKVFIYYTPETPESEILSSIALIESTSEAMIYLHEVESTETASEPLSVINHYEYKLQSIINKYAERDLNSLDKANLLEEITLLSSQIKEPIQRDLFIKTLSGLEDLINMGISKSSIEDKVKELREKKEKAKQDKKTRELIDKAEEFYSKGKTEEALELLHTQSREVKQLSNIITFESLLIPPTEKEIKEKLLKHPQSLNTGYCMNNETEEMLQLPSGALTFFVAPSGHGKTTMLINLLLNTAEEYPEKQFHFFSYEEDRESITLKTLSSYCNMFIASDNLKTLKSYYAPPYKKGSSDREDKYKYFNKQVNSNIVKDFEVKREPFFKNLIDTNRINIHYVDYNSDTLIEAIEYLHKHTKNIGGIFVDYMQLLRKANRKIYGGKRFDELKDICSDLKDLAVNTGLPLVLGAQFNKNVVNHGMIHQTYIGEAGDIERYANQIIGFWNNTKKPSGDDKVQEKFKISGNTLYCKILKSRDNASELEFLLGWEGNIRKISNLEQGGANLFEGKKKNKGKEEKFPF